MGKIILTASSDDYERAIVSEGVHQAICVGIYDIGTQNGLYGKKRQVIISFEIPEERITVDGKDLPLIISKRYTLSGSPKSSLRRDLETWRGKPYVDEAIDLEEFLGKNCLLQIVHQDVNGVKKAKIAGIMTLPKSMKPMRPESPMIIYSIDDGEPPSEVPDWIKQLINSSEERAVSF